MERRVYVGGLLNDQKSCIDDLSRRFQKYGQIVDGNIEQHAGFAYINMRFKDETEFTKFRSKFNNVKFKGNTLRIALAKPSWQESWKSQHEQDMKDNVRIQEQNNIREYEYRKKIENIRKSRKDLKELISGRIRKTLRKKHQLKAITFRIDVQGSLKVYKCYKTKLWGYERDRNSMDMVFKFVGNKWLDGYDHIVDKLDYSRSKQYVSLRKRSKELCMKETENNDILQEEEDGVNKDEELNTAALAQVLDGFDFNKPLAVEASDKEEDYGSSDYELEAKYATKEESASQNNVSEDEPVPAFGTEKEEKSLPQGTVSNTDVLRELFNPEDDTTQTFKLIEDSNEDINSEKQIFEATAVDITPAEIMPLPMPQKQKGLFFPHFDSPFLAGQTQLSKLQAPPNESLVDDWEDEFWNNRGVWMKEMKRKRRDALRRVKKRSGINSGLLI